MADLSGPKMRIGQIRRGADSTQGRRPFHADDRGHRRRPATGLGQLRTPAEGGETGRQAFAQRRLHPARGGGSARQRRGLHGHGGRRIALAQRTEPAGHRSRHQRVHGAGSRVSEIRAGAWRGRRQPVLCRKRGGHAGRAQGGARTGPRAVSHREDRAFARPGAARRDSRRGGRHHDRARRSGRGSAHRANRRRAKGHHAPGQPAGQTGHHRHADAGVHDPLIACRRAPRRPTSRTPSSTAPMP